MAGWVVTAPQELPVERQEDFFVTVYDFLENRYGKENVVQAAVHDDEGGQPHLHFYFIPVADDPKHDEGFKVCANEVLDRRELRNFHPDLQRYLSEHGLEDAHIMTGVTKRQGGNRTVAELKEQLGDDKVVLGCRTESRAQAGIPTERGTSCIIFW